MNFVRAIFLGIVWAVAAAGYPGADVLAFYVDQHHYTACTEAVPIRRTPDMKAQRIATIPEGTAVKVDRVQDRWSRVIYKIREDLLYRLVSGSIAGPHAVTERSLIR